MLFDVFCAAAELSSDKDMKSVARSAALFDFPYVPHEVLSKNSTDEEIAFLHESFFLPFRTIAVEDKATCCVLQDLEKDQTGITTDRMFFDVLPVCVDPENFRPLFPGKEGQERASLSALGSAAIELGLARTFLISKGFVSLSFENSGREKIAGGISRIWRYSADAKELTDLSEALFEDVRMREAVVQSELCNGKTAIEEVIHFNTPERFVVEVTPRTTRPQNSTKIPRSHERRRYLLLKPSEIKVMFGDKEEGCQTGRGGPAPHQRRRHWRHLRSEKFVNMKGKSIVIPASWVGASEAEVSGRRYKVMLDL